MKRPGNIGQPRKPLTPRSGEIEAALSLLNVMGGGAPKMREYLEDLRAAISFNEKLLADIQHELAQLGDLKKREREVGEQETKVDAKLAEWASIRSSWKIYETTK